MPPESPSPREAARAQQRKLEWLSVEVQNSGIADALERAKSDLASCVNGLNTDPMVALALWRAGDFATVRRLLAEGLDDSFLSARYSSAAGAQSEAAAFVLNITDNILGIEADASRGRLVLRPLLPKAWTDVVVRNMRIGDAAIEMRFLEDNSVCRFSLMQTSGAYPIRLIFEPALIPPVRFVFVDGVLATLDVRTVDGRIVAPVQIMLDDKRVVEFQKA